MTTLAPPPELGASAVPPAGGRKVDGAFRALAFTAGLLVLAILGLIAYITTHNAWPAFTHQGFSFFTSNHWDPNVNSFGAADFEFGTIMSAFIAIVIAVPASLGIALFITELAPRRVRAGTTYVVDLLASIPSVVYGFWALAVLTTPLKNDVYDPIANTIGKVPIFRNFLGGPASGQAFMTAGIVLAIMIIPIITSISREVLSTVAQDDKNAALAMGATRWEMLRIAVFPRVRSGLIGATMLGLGRAMGETIAVALVIGGSHQITSHLFYTGDSMASVIAHNFGEATGLSKSALIGLGVVLFAITIVINVIARSIANRTSEMTGVGR